MIRVTIIDTEIKRCFDGFVNPVHIMNAISYDDSYTIITFANGETMKITDNVAKLYNKIKEGNDD